ncbi:hypothetical protein C824_000056 [Schaedlerella arabinosiphila]|nr:hypothetical protein C824_000056 [Schaedlerella arabinosiphila]
MMGRTEQEDNFSNNVIWYNFILCVLVILIHARNDSIFTLPVQISGFPVFNELEAFLASDVAGAAVGGFYLGSGYLFFRNYSWKRVFSKYKSRVKSLVIPYILWTLLYFFIHAGISRIPVLAAVFREAPIQITWKSMADAVLHYRYCAFLWFLQFLILYAAFSPAIYLLIRSRYFGAAAILVVFFTACTNIIKNEQAAAVTNWMTLYMLGGYIGIHLKGIVEKGKTSTRMLMGTLILAAASFWIYKKYPSVFGVLFYSFSFSAALWCLTAWEKDGAGTMPRARGWQKNTFAVYMTHFMIVQGVNALAGRYISQSMWVGFFLFLILPAVCFGVVQLAKRICGNGTWILWKIWMGSR